MASRHISPRQHQEPTPDEAKRVTRQTVGKGRNTSTPGAFPFLKLPSELKNEIYKYVLTSPHMLRRCESIQAHRTRRMVATFSPQSLRATHRNEVLLSQWRDTALLFTCRTMYNEGLSILYSHNKLHFPILTKGVMLNQRQGSSFSLLTSVSIDYSYTFLSAWDVYRRQVFWTMEVARQVDSTISKGVRQLTAGCPRLKTLTLHIVSFAAFAHLTTLAAHDMCKTTIALSALTDRLDCLTVVGMPERRGLHGVFRPRDGASMVATGYAGSEHALLNSIAPVARWEQEARQVLWEPHVPWPGLKVSNDFIFRDNQIASHEPFRLYEHGNEHRRGIAPRSMKAQKEQIWHLRRSKRDAAGDGTATPAH